MVKITVVIPTYRRPELLRKCLNALKEQRFAIEEYEVIVVSDGPDHATKDLMSEWFANNSRFQYLQLPVKRGPAAARNFGWQHANGVLIAFTDDDTLPDAHWLPGLWQAYMGEIEVAYSGRIKVPISNDPTDYEKNTAGLETAEFVTANCCCTKAALEKTGGFDERFSMAWREDSDLEFKLLLNNIPIIHVPEALVVHPVRKAPWGISLKEQKKGMFNALLYKKYPELYRRKIQANPLWNYYIMVGTAILLMTGIVIKSQWISLVAFSIWSTLFLGFVIKRLRQTSKRIDHIAEMIITSLFIPFVSVYWQLYGAWRYRVFFL